MKQVIAGLVFILTLLILPVLHSPVFAQSAQFTTSYQVNYEINSEGGGQVTNTISIKNNTAEFYVADFTLKIPDSGIENIKAYRNRRELKTQTKQKENEIEVTVTFDQATVGQGKVTTFDVTYVAKTIARRNGNNLDVTIPGISKDYQGVYNVDVVVPNSFVTPYARIFPKPEKQQQADQTTTYSYNRDQLKENSIFMNFGDSQLYELNLTYYLKNPTSKKVSTEIALPPDTEYQTITYQDITPKPEKITVDQDGNYLAKYLLEPNQEFEVQLHAYASVSSKQLQQFPALTEEQISQYTQPQQYWEVDDPTIKEQVEKLEDVKSIYDFTVQTLSYNKAKLERDDFERLGAKQILNNPDDAVCMEFTDLFIALARAKGIPARELNGYAFTNDRETRPLSLSQDVLHAWPEYYDQAEKRWIPVDPTWGNTTGGMDYFSQFDTNHIVFVRKGISSTFPYPAGAYKRDPSSTNVFVNVSTEIIDQTKLLDISLTGNSWKLSGMKTDIDATFTNRGNSAIIGNIETSLQGSNQAKKQTVWMHLPAFASINRQFEINPDWNQRDSLSVTASQNDIKAVSMQKVELYPFYQHPYILIGTGYIIILIALTIIFNAVVQKSHARLTKVTN